MLKKVIAGWNAAPGAPANWDPAKDGDCGALPIRYWPRTAKLDGSGPRIQWCESAWEPTPKELDLLNAGGQIVLRVWGWQVPVAIYTEPLHTDGDTSREPALPPKPFEVSTDTYQEIRRLLLKDGVVGTFDVANGRETMELSGVTLVARSADRPATPMTIDARMDRGEPERLAFRVKALRELVELALSTQIPAGLRGLLEDGLRLDDSRTT